MRLSAKWGESASWLFCYSFSEKVYFCHIKFSEKMYFCGVFFKEKVLNIC